MKTSDISIYLDYCTYQKRLSPTTLRAYKRDLYQFMEHDSPDIRSYVSFLYKKYEKMRTVKRKIASLKAFYTYLEMEELVVENPFRKLSFRYPKERELPKTIPLSELKRVHHYLKNLKLTAKTPYQIEKTHRNLLIMELLISTGLRISELCQLKLEQIDLVSKSLFVIGKGKKERIIYLGHSQTYYLLKEYIKRHHNEKHHFLFVGYNGYSHLQEQSVRLIFNSLKNKLQLKSKLTPHMFRHTFATMLLDENVDIRYIQHILGHSSISVTQIYTHVSHFKQQEILTNHNPLNQLNPLERTIREADS